MSRLCIPLVYCLGTVFRRALILLHIPLLFAYSTFSKILYNAHLFVYVSQIFMHEVHVISAKHFTSGYQSEILHAVYIPSKLRNSTGRQPVNPQMWSGRSKPPTSQCKICKLL